VLGQTKLIDEFIDAAVREYQRAAESRHGPRPFWIALLTAVSALAALLLAIAMHPPILGDDGAITLRYAERLATGHGFTYNDHERVLGASNPLFVLVLSLIVRTGVDPVSASTGFGFVSYCTAVAAATWLAGRAAGSLAAIVTAVALLGDAFFRAQALGGLEVALAVTLGLAAIAAMAEGHDVLGGMLAGFALWNKIDAAAVVVAVVVGAAIVRRRFPIAFIAAALVIMAPWLVWSTWYFGSPVPHSMVSKLTVGRMRPFDPWWVGRVLTEPSRRYVLLAIPLTWAASRRVSPSTRMTAIACTAWAILHAVAYSTFNLGDRYPWYLAVPLGPLAVITGLAAAAAATRFPGWMRAAALVVTVLGVRTAVGTTSAAWRTRDELRPWEAFDADRRLAGVFLREYAAPGEVVECAFGWPAFESRLPCNDSGFLNSVEILEPVSYSVKHGDRAENGNPPEAPPGMIPLATFDMAHRRFPTYTAFVVFGRPDSAIARSGIRALSPDIAARVLRDGRFSEILR
jgi:MFS family permease